MRNFWLVIVISATLATAGALSSASAQDAVERSRVVLIPDGASDRAQPADPSRRYVTHNLCGIGLGGYCPGRYRSCIRAGRPRAECETWVARCDACNQAMLECRQKVGHQPGSTCPPCRKALDKCRASLSAPVK